MLPLEITFSDELTPFLRRKNKGKTLVKYCLTRKASVKDIIESLGIPHTDIGQIVAQKKQVNFDFVPDKQQNIKVLPICQPFDVTTPSFLRPRPLKKIRFVVDVNVGKLALLLRILGMDTKYDPGLSDKEIAFLAYREDRIVLSKDIGLLKRKTVIFGRYIRSVHPDDQLKEVIDFFGIKGRFDLFSRCPRCNKTLVPVDKKDILHRLEPKTRKYFSIFKTCIICTRIYWQGSHHDKMKKRLQKAGIDVS
jgi:uncharacterized protein with PIN domain